MSDAAPTSSKTQLPSADEVVLSDISQEQGSVLSGHHVFQDRTFRRRLFDQQVSDWSAKYKRDRHSLGNLSRDCELLRGDITKQQQAMEERAEILRQLEEKTERDAVNRCGMAKESYDDAVRQRSQLQTQLSEQRKQKAQLAREKKLLASDYERKHAEVVRVVETRDRLEAQLALLAQQLGQVNSDKKRLERELDLVQHNVRANAELAGEVRSEISDVFRSVKDSLNVQTGHGLRGDGKDQSSQILSPVSPRSPVKEVR